jgi:ubiquitin-like-conjugating enzyme ATG10
MKAVAGNRRLTADEYLVMWLGAFGKCVGLNVPLALARHMDSTVQDVD